MLTNEHNLPQVFYDAATAITPERRDNFHYSPTTLINPPRQVQLIKRHKDKIDEDLFRWWYSFVGNAFHDKLKEGLDKFDKYVVEQRVIIPVKVVMPDGSIQEREVGFKPDVVDKENNILYDWKSVTVWMHGKESKPEWIQQLNMYVQFLKESGSEMKEACIMALYKDWREAAGRYKDGDYPEIPVALFKVPLWSETQRKAFINQKLVEHIQAEDIPDDALPFCSSDDMWESPPKYAVYRPGAERALKLCNSMQEAEAYISYKSLRNCRVEFRPGSRKRCESYCSAAPFCNQYQQWLQEQDNNFTEALLVDAKITPTTEVSYEE